MVTSTFATPATATLAMAAARSVIDEFGCSFVRVWLGDGFDSAEPIATLGGAPDGDRKFTAQAASRAISSGRRSLEPVSTGASDTPSEDGYRVCLPLRGAGLVFGCVECYRVTDVTFAHAEHIETSLGRFAIAMESAAATDALERESRGMVLVVDEDPNLRELLATALQRSGFTTLDAPDGLAAFDALGNRTPNLVLMNFSLGIKNRFATDLLRRRPFGTPTPIVMLVEGNDAVARVAAMEAGADECIAKPFEIRDLVTRIANVLRWRELLARSADAGGAQNGARKRPSKVEASALYESRHGNLDGALEIFVREAEACESSQRFDGAARAYRGAALAASEMRKEDLANKFTRLAGKMYLTFAETTTNARGIESAYVSAAKCFLEAGNMQLASKSLVLADEFETAIEANVVS